MAGSVIRFPQRAIDEVREFLFGAEPEVVESGRAAELVEAFCELERLAVAGKLLFAGRAAESTKWAVEGHRSPEAWLAAASGSSMGEAISVVQTADRLCGLDKTSEALRRGDLSQAQAKEVTSAAQKDPAKERELLQAATSQSLKALKAKARRIRLSSSSAEEENERYAKIHASRYCRHWSDEEGAFRLEARLAADAGARLAGALETETNAVFNSARASGTREHTQAYRADALVGLVCGRALGSQARGSSQGDEAKKPRSGSRTDTVVIRIDAAALRRGYAKPGELCEIPGVGPVPVASARRAMGEGFLKIVIKDAVDVRSVCHAGRSVPAHIQSALEERDPTCVLCDCAFGLENHHWKTDYAKCRTTSLEGLARVCKHHHDLITYEGFKLTGGPGAWELVSPPAPEILDSG